MLNDDQLTDELGAAFRAGTSELTYSGRRRPRRGTAAVPALAVAAALATVAVAAAVNAGDEDVRAPQAGTSVSASPDGTPSSAPLVTEKIQLAGFTLSYDRAAGSDPLHAVTGVSVPDGATKLAVDQPGTQAWGGTDAESGAPAIFVKVADSGNVVYELTGAGMSVEQLTELLDSAHARAVPAVER